MAGPPAGIAAVPTPVIKEMRWMLYASGVLVLALSFFLFLFPGRTDVLFAWTINPPLTAAFLGANYLASAFLEFSAARRAWWAEARVAVPGVLIFTLLTTLVTFIHLDRFHLASDNAFTLFVTWVWIVVYIVDPLLLSFALVRQLRQPRVDPPRTRLLPGWYRAALYGSGGLLAIMGAAMLLIPATMIPFWPWELTPLTCRALGAWGVGIGVVLLQAGWENDWSRVRPMTAAYLAVGLLQGVNLLRFPESIELSNPAAVVYLLWVASAVVVGGYGVAHSWRGGGYGKGDSRL
jgi:hypothetical protein